jgi:hypothetical protein
MSSRRPWANGRIGWVLGPPLQDGPAVKAIQREAVFELEQAADSTKWAADHS